MDEPAERTRRRWPLGLVIIVGACLLFFSQCMHVACMTGVACVPYIGPPPWYERWQSGRLRDDDERRYQSTLNPLQKAIRDKDPAAVGAAIRAAPEQVGATTSRDESTLDLAVEAGDANAITRLLAAGADGLTSRQGDGHASPFVQALRKDVQRLADERPEAGGQAASRPDATRGTAAAPPLLIEPFLATRKLDAKSPEAADLLVEAADSTVVFDRLLAYGIPFALTSDLLQQLIRAQNDRLLQRVLGAAPGPDQQPARWAERDQDGVLRTALQVCRFDVANQLLDRGSATGEPGTWVTAALHSCSGAQWFGGTALKTAAQVAALDRFLARVVGMGVALNSAAASSTCPPWLGGYPAGSLCKLPDDPPLVRTLIALGADPFLYLGDRHDPPVLQAWKQCDGNPADGLLWTLLAAPPGTDRRGLSQTFAAIFDSSSDSWCRRQTDPDRQAVAAALLAKGADPDGVDGYGRSALTYVLERDVITLATAQWLVAHGASIDKLPVRDPSANPLPDPKAPEVIATLRAMARRRP